MPNLIASVKCNAKTERGFIGLDKDDIYWLMFVKDSNGSFYTARVPPSGDIGFDDGDVKNGIQLLDVGGMISAGDGHATEVFIAMMEEDQARFDTYTGALERAMRARSVPRGGAFGRAMVSKETSDDEDRKLIEWLIWAAKQAYGLVSGNTDDVPGVVHMRMINQGGSIRSIWTSIDRARLVSTSANSAAFVLNGDGANYEVTYDIVP